MLIPSQQRIINQLNKLDSGYNFSYFVHYTKIVAFGEKYPDYYK
jgi:hypothetical protein